MSFIETENASKNLREKAIDLKSQSILITNFANSEQEKDFSEPSNCRGFGRIRHFKLDVDRGWPKNPLPILPAIKALDIQDASMIRAQVFQNAVCNWRCWYCFVDFKLLSGNRQFSSFLDCDTMLDYYLEQSDAPLVIDLTGGQPDITPEWVPWMMTSLIKRNLHSKVYLWSDDNLSNDYFWRYLNEEQIELIANYKNYGRVCCFKGIDELSFSQNTGADPSLFDNQFHLFERLLKIGIDLYSYITLPASLSTDFNSVIPRFLDKIQAIDEMYPLRIIPLKIMEFSPVVKRMKSLQIELLAGQEIAINIWRTEIEKRFSSELRNKGITNIKTKYQRHE